MSNWDRYFLDIANTVSTRATCPRLSVGALIVRDRTILSTGYNGSISGSPHCKDAGCLIVDNHCIRTVHAETNAILRAARHGVDIAGSTMYITAFPCWNCFKNCANTGIVRIVYSQEYRKDPLVVETANALKIIMNKV
jgi:dCMP deaminase